MIMRKYLANYDDGHDYGSFEFYSSHRAGSKANIEDAKSSARNQFGRISRGWEITSVVRA